MSTTGPPETAALVVDEEKAEDKGETKHDAKHKEEETPEAKKNKISQFEAIMIFFNILFWATVCFFGLYELRAHWSGGEHAEYGKGSFQWIHEISKGFILIGLALLGSVVTLREAFLSIHKTMTAIALEVAHTMVMIPAGGIVVYGPWADTKGANANMLCTTLGHLAFFASFILSFFNIVTALGRTVLRH